MNRLLLLILTAASLLLVPRAEAAKRQVPTNFEGTEGSLLHHLMEEADAERKAALMEDFVAKHGAHESTPWVYGELQAAYLKANQYAKAIAAGEKVLAADPDDVQAASANLKAGEGAKDPDLMLKWAVASSNAARHVIASPKPTDADEATAWAASVEYSKQTDAYCDYVLYLLATQATDPKKRVELGELLVSRSPASNYVASFRPQLFFAYQQAGNHARAFALAEQDIKAGSTNDDMLIYAANKSYEQKDKVKTTAYAKKLIETSPANTVPAGQNEADWNKNKSLKLGIAHWMLGVIASTEQRWVDADSHLRIALPLVSSNNAIQAEALFHLAMANYKLGDPKGDKARILDALKYNQQCAAIAGPLQAQAKKNVAAIRSQYHIQ